MSVECVFTKYTGPLRCFDQFIPDLGLAYVSSALKQEGYTCKLFNLDLPENSPGDLLDYLGRYNPKVLAVKLLRTGVPNLIKIVEEAREVSPTTLIVGGGPHAQVCRETILELTNAFDALLIGESDRAIVQVVEVAHGERELRDVDNVLFRDESGNLVKGLTSVIDDLDELPLPDWGLDDLERYFPIFPISARRGCPYACTFCNYNYVASRENTKTQITDSGTVRVTRKVPTRKRSLQSLQEEMHCCIDEYGAHLFALTDATPDTQLTDELCDWLIDSGTTTRWTSFARIKSMDRLFEKMARAGWVSIWFGIESGSEKILKLMNKTYAVEEIRHTIDAAHKSGIKSIGAFIMGFPGEDESTLAETFGLSQELPLDGVVFSPFALVPGSIVAEIPEAYGIKPHEDWVKKYAYVRGGQGHHDIPYFDVEGADNLSRLKRFNPLIDNAYKKIRHRQVTDDVDYAELIATVMEGMSAKDVLLETDALLNSGDFRRWNAFLSRVWRATENMV